MSRTKANRRGLTFLEVLIVLTVFALLMLAGMILLHSMVQAHYTVETNSAFEQHTGGVGKLIHSLAVATATAEGRAGPHYRWTQSPVSNRRTLSFRVDQEIPFFVSDLVPLPPLTAFLEFDAENEQFWLAWFPDPRFTEGRRNIQYTLLSPWASDIEYGYYGGTESGWQFERLSSGERTQGNRRPQRVTLIFERAGQIKRRTIRLEETEQHVLQY